MHIYTANQLTELVLCLVAMATTTYWRIYRWGLVCVTHVQCCSISHSLITGLFHCPWAGFQKGLCVGAFCQHRTVQPHVWWVDQYKPSVNYSLVLTNIQVCWVSLLPLTTERWAPSITSLIPPSSPPSLARVPSLGLLGLVKPATTRRTITYTVPEASVTIVCARSSVLVWTTPPSMH